jgi:hypothetical protein
MIRHVQSFHDLVATPFAGGINALCWPRTPRGDFAEIVACLGPGEGIVGLVEKRLRALPLSVAGREAAELLLEDLRQLRSHGFAPELNCIYGYPRDEAEETFPTDVYSFHADRAPIAADTWLCTYHGAPSEGLANDEAQRRVDVPALRAELVRRFDGNDDSAFASHLEETSQDLHYIPLPHAQPFSFGVGHLWRIAVDHPGNPVPPCIHRAPAPRPEHGPRLLLIS